ncbi:hypothetical protein Mpal_1349 [Methanosphaerula palustris E1-9c]|uniref:Uncharacterized protein n=1 Tax=Methanosphaerula palustris (strain ATCC BAA-1556 / DSM 19958 / E1-9c) TaxID=521011 RepID=B8GHU2_METPE|nr:hypothetical protein Mpal_1349 [Methanosphaerula palustris E1-9c]
MSLLYRQDLQDNNQLSLFIDIIKNSIPSGEMKPVDDRTAS